MVRRRRYLINKRMQLGLTTRFTFLTVLFSAFIAFEVFITIWPVVSGLIPGPLMHIVRHQIFMRFVVFIIPVIFVITGFSIVLTHRIAGPLYRLEKTLDAFMEGQDVGDIRLRKNDELKGLAERINELMRMAKEARTSKKDASEYDEKIVQRASV
jgi:hypothetical protein